MKRAAAALGASHAEALQRKLDVLNDVEPRKEGGLLKYHTALGASACDFSPADPDAASRRSLEARDKVQQGRLTTTRWTDEADELALRHVEVDVAQRSARAATVARRERLRERGNL